MTKALPKISDGLLDDGENVHGFVACLKQIDAVGVAAGQHLDDHMRSVRYEDVLHVSLVDFPGLAPGRHEIRQNSRIAVRHNRLERLRGQLARTPHTRHIRLRANLLDERLVHRVAAAVVVHLADGHRADTLADESLVVDLAAALDLEPPPDVAARVVAELAILDHERHGEFVLRNPVLLRDGHVFRCVIVRSPLPVPQHAVRADVADGEHVLIASRIALQRNLVEGTDLERLDDEPLPLLFLDSFIEESCELYVPRAGY